MRCRHSSLGGFADFFAFRRGGCLWLGRCGRCGKPQRHHGRVFAVEHAQRVRAKDARLGCPVGRHVAMPIQVVLRQVEQHGSRGLKAIATVKLKARQLQHPHLRQRAGVDVRGQGVEQRGTDVAGHGHCAAGVCQGVRGERCHRRFAVGAGHGQHCRRIAMGLAQRLQCHGIQVQFASSAYSTCASSYQYRSNLGRTQTGRAVHGRHALPLHQTRIQGACDKAHPWQFLLQRGQLGRCRAGVGHRHPSAAAHAPARHRQARSPQAQNQHMLAVQRQCGAVTGSGIGAGRPAGGHGRQFGWRWRSSMCGRTDKLGIDKGVGALFGCG